MVSMNIIWVNGRMSENRDSKINDHNIAWSLKKSH